MITHAPLLALASLVVPSLTIAGPSSQTPFVGRPRPDVERYDDEQVWRLDWSGLDSKTREVILNSVELLDMDIWRASPSSLDMRLHTSSISHLARFIPPFTPFSPFITDLQTLVDSTFPSTEPPRVRTMNAWDLETIATAYHDGYHSLEDMYGFGDALLQRFDGVEGLKMETFVVGESFEGRQIRGWKARIVPGKGDERVMASGSGGRKGKGKRGGEMVEAETELEFIVEGGQHAREWVGPSTSLYWFHSLLLDATSDPSSEAAHLLKTFTFTVVPTINPDGYVYSHEHSRLWRKNRQPVGSNLCAGIDLNSNWGYKWRPSRTSPCSDSYSGRTAFQSFETKAMSRYLVNGTEEDRQEDPRRRVKAFVDLHSYGQLFMFPFAHSCEDFPPDAENLMEAGLGVAKVMRKGHGEAYQAGQACDLTYRAPGDAIDYAYGITDVKWSYSAELRDTGTYGFLLPPSLIRPAAEEMSDGLKYLAKFIYVTDIAN